MIQDNVAKAIKRILGVDEVPFNVPPKREFGDFSTAVALSQAKVQKRAPIQIAEDLKAQLEAAGTPFVKEIVVTPPGYLNFKIDQPRYVKSVVERVFRQGDAFGRSNVGRGRRVLVEHTNVNPNKAMHIGHVRNAIIGDTVVRVLGRLGYDVQACNYIDDTGVQVADVIVGMLYMDEPVYDGKSEDFTEIWAKYDGTRPFDYWCWDLYARVVSEYEKNPDLKARRAEIIHKLEAQDNLIAEFGKKFAGRIVGAHLDTVARLNVYYDLLNWESDILRRGFWQTAFERLRETGAIVYETEGPNKGCWIVPFGKGVFDTDEGLRSEDKILVRSDGTATYTAKDIAYQMWKYGVLGQDFLYKLWGIQDNCQELWTSGPTGHEMDRFGRADRVINVIDVRQSYLQQVVYESLKRLGFKREARNSIHLDYEVVVLSNSAAAELGVDVDAEEPGMQAMSGRKGLGVKADDLINEIIRRVGEKVQEEKNARVLAASAIRYFMSRISTNKLIVFDFDEALRTVGETGVYCQYAHARACSILRKAEIGEFGKAEVPEKVTEPEETLVQKIAEFPGTLKKAGQELSPTPLAHYAFELATVFTGFYESPDPGAAVQTPFIKIADPALRAYRLALVSAFRQTMANALNALGITPLERI